MTLREPPYDPNNYLSFAEAISNDGKYDKVTRFRVSVGRSYYAAFVQSRDKLRTLGEIYDPLSRAIGEGGEHQFVITKLTAKDGTAGDYLSKLMKKRVDADYHMDRPIGWDSTTRSIRLAKEVIKKLPLIR